MKKRKGFWIRRYENGSYIVYYSKRAACKDLFFTSGYFFPDSEFQRLTGLKCKIGEMLFIPHAGLKKITRLVKTFSGMDLTNIRGG